MGKLKGPFWHKMAHDEVRAEQLEKRLSRAVSLGMAASCSWSRAACLVALWAAVVSNGNAITESALAKHHKTFLLSCHSDCQGTGSDILWYIHDNNVWKHINSRKKEIGYTKYIDNKNGSMTIKDPDWEGSIWHGCQWSCQEHDSYDKFTDTSIRLIKDVKTNNIIEAEVGEKISISCRGNSESRITGSVEWRFALPGQPFYPVNTVSGKKHSIDNNKSLLIDDLHSEDAGFYLCELNNCKDLYETKVNIIQGRSGVDLTPVSIAVSVVVCTAIACGAVCYAWKQWKIGRSNRASSATDNVDRTYTSLTILPALYETIRPSETETEEEYAEVTFIGE